MDRIYASGASGIAPSAPASPSTGYPTSGNPGAGTPPTKPGAYWYHMIMEELMAIITAGGITPAPGTLNQVKQALDALYLPITASVGSSVQGSFKNLQLSATGTGANVSVSADEIVVENASNAYKTLRAVSLAVAGVSSGVANGLDTGAIAASTWYSVWVIAKPDGTTAGLFSLSPTAPTMPAGYTFKARVGWIVTDGTANKYPLSFKQFGRSVQYVVSAGGNLTAQRQMQSGSNAGVLTAVAVSGFVPPTASRIMLAGGFNGSTSANTVMLVSTNSAGTSGTQSVLSCSQGSSGFYANTLYASALLESGNIYVLSTSTSSFVNCIGWEDNL